MYYSDDIVISHAKKKVLPDEDFSVFVQQHLLGHSVFPTRG